MVPAEISIGILSSVISLKKVKNLGIYKTTWKFIFLNKISPRGNYRKIFIRVKEII